MHRTSRVAARAALTKMRRLRLLAEDLLEDVRSRDIDAGSLAGLASEYEEAREWALRNAQEVYELMPSVETSVVQVSRKVGADEAEMLLWRIATGCRVAEKGLEELLHSTRDAEDLLRELEALDDESEEQSVSAHRARQRRLHVKALIDRTVKAFRSGRPVKRPGKNRVEKIIEELFVPYSYPG